MTYFDMLDNIEKQKVLRKVNRFFNKTFYYKTLFQHKIFKATFPFEYSNIPIGDLKGEPLELHNYLFEQSQLWISKIFDKLTEKQSLKQLAKRKKSKLKSTFRQFAKGKYKNE